MTFGCTPRPVKFMEQLIGIIAILGYVTYIFGKEDRLLRFSQNLKERFRERRARSSRRRISHHEYIEKVVDNANEKYWEQKKIAEGKEKVRKNFL